MTTMPHFCRRRLGRWLAVGAAVLGTLRVAAAEPDGLVPLGEPDAARDARVAWHREARFGCFVHWGVYAALGNEFDGRKGGGYAEHIMRVLKIPRAVYLERVAQPFNPEQFDADAWVRLMRDAGMRYLIITAKHHDGFAMYPSKVTPYNLTTASAFKRDPMRELSDACRKHGLKFGFYYSHAFDWEHPDAPGNDWDYDNPGGDKLLHGGRDWWKRYPEFLPRAQRYVNEKSIPQIQELVALYHPDILWFDTPHKLPPEENRRILQAVRDCAPGVVVNGRLVANYGDYKNTGDRPAYFPETAGHWEAIPTTNESYGYSKFDLSHKPPEHFIRLLALTVAKGGNLLMNIGPKGDGTIDPVDQGILRGIGAWMQQYGESIYGCDRTPLPVQGWGASTRKGNRLYLHVFDWPADGRLLVAGLKTDPTSARLLGAAGPGLTVKRVGPDDVEIQLPARSPDKVDSVIVLDFAGAIAANKALRVAPAGATTTLHVMAGRLTGKGIRYGDGKRTRDVVEEWSAPDGAVSWTVRVPQAARFRVAANYNTAAKDNTGTFVIEAAGQSISGQVTPTGNLATFRTDTVGELALPAGEHTLTVRPGKIAGANLMRLRQLELTPGN